MSRARDVASNNLALISAGSDGQILTSDGTDWAAENAPTELPAHGADGNLLTSDGSAWVSQAPAPAGSRTLISNTDMTSASTVTRTADFSTSYSQYEVELRQFRLDLSSAGVSETYGRMYLIDDQGTDITSNYMHKTQHLSYGQPAYDTTAENTGQVYFGMNRSNASSMQDVDGTYYNFSVTLYDPCKAIVESGDTINSTPNAIWGNTRLAGRDDVSQTRWYNGWFYNSAQTRQITGIKFVLNDGSFTSGKLLVWGVGS